MLHQGHPPSAHTARCSALSHHRRRGLHDDDDDNDNDDSLRAEWASPREATPQSPPTAAIQTRAQVVPAKPCRHVLGSVCGRGRCGSASIQHRAPRGVAEPHSTHPRRHPSTQRTIEIPTEPRPIPTQATNLTSPVTSLCFRHVARQCSSPASCPGQHHACSCQRSEGTCSQNKPSFHLGRICEPSSCTCFTLPRLGP